MDPLWFVKWGAWAGGLVALALATFYAVLIIKKGFENDDEDIG